jgi:hypothetical protein
VRRALGWAALLAAAASPALAGPPYVTDDPQPTDLGHWEIYHFATAGHVAGDTAGEAGLDLNYGVARDVQATLVIPLAFDRADGGTRYGMGVVEAAAKFKLLHEARDGIDLAVFPRLFVPTAPARFASRRANLLLPVWAGKDFGPWSVFGGGGYQLNPGSGAKDFWTGGLALTRDLGERLQLGAEVTHRTADAPDGRAFTAVNLGAIWKLTSHWSLLAGGGPGVQNAREEGRYDVYLALKADY